MAKYDYDLIVIGGGAAGLTAATGAGQLGAKTLLIEKKKELGGDCLHYGCVPSKSLIKSAYCYNVLKNSQKYGLPKVDVPKVDYKEVRSRIQNIIGTIQKHDSPEYIKEKYNVDTQFGQPKFLDSHTIELDGKKITSKCFIISTGSSPVIAPIEGLDGVPYVTNLDIFSLDKLPESLIVLGGGPIGMEMTQAFSRLGSKVTVIEFSNQLLSKEDADIGEFIKNKLESERATVYINSKAIKVCKDDNAIAVTFSNNETKQELTIKGGMLLVSTGRKANVDGLDLQKIGLEYTKRGIKVDNRLRTTVKNIYACGDVNGGYQFTHVAGYEGGVAMVNCLMHLPVKTDYSNVPWCTYLDPEVASVGYNEKRAKDAGIEYTVRKEEFIKNDRALAEGETGGFIKILINKKGKTIGVQIVGYHAGDLIHEWVAAINGKVSLSTIAQAIHAYPTLSEISKAASGNFLAPKFFNNKVRKILKLIFGLQGENGARMKKKKWIDISVSIKSGMANWPGDSAVVIKPFKSIKKGNSSNASHLSMGSHTGTHMDAPFHFICDAKTLDQMSLNATIGPARVIEIKDKKAINIEELKKNRIRRGERILFKTVNSLRCWKTDKFKKDFVYIPEETAKYLAKAGVCAVGVDYLSVGGYKKDGAQTHRALLKAGIWIIEGLNLSKVKQGRYELICLPLKILNADGAPARAILRG